MSEITITSQNFNEVVNKSDKPVLIDLWASWCGPCQMLAPVISQIAEEHPEIKVGKVNVDEQPELAAAFNVSSIPMVVLVKDGKVVNSAVGYRPKSSIEAMFA
jgi:thioredoxin 1